MKWEITLEMPLGKWNNTKCLLKWNNTTYDNTVYITFWTGVASLISIFTGNYHDLLKILPDMFGGRGVTSLCLERGNDGKAKSTRKETVHVSSTL